LLWSESFERLQQEDLKWTTCGFDEFLQVGFAGNLLGRDFTQSRNRFFVLKMADHRFRTIFELTAPASGDQDERKAILNLTEAIFDGYAGHSGPSLQNE
jgi:hypothetical protein